MRQINHAPLSCIHIQVHAHAQSRGIRAPGEPVFPRNLLWEQVRVYCFYGDFRGVGDGLMVTRHSKTNCYLI